MSAAGLMSWGQHPPHPQTPHPCHWLGDLPGQLERVASLAGTTLPHGAGLSYGDSCLAESDHVLHLRPLDRLLAADWSQGWVRAEAGMTLGDILELSIPRGWFLAVTPGTQHVTLGGAIANDVHGKNHHRRGAFGRHVRSLGLLRSDSGRHTCSPQQDDRLFAATIGGLGLTGLVEWAEIQLMPIRSSRIDVVTQRFQHLDEFFSLATELDPLHEFCVAWVDCLARGPAAGRGIFIAGDFAAEGPLRADRRRRWTIPFTPPVPLVTPVTLRAFNGWYWHRSPRRRTRAPAAYESFFYPLDAVGRWNRLYGPRGLQQYQALIPERHARAGVAALLDAVAAAGSGSFLAVLKRCGDLPSPGLISFPGPGTTLALDFPHHDGLDGGLFARLDAIVREAGGRLYPAKDAHWGGADFRAAYPRWEQLEALRDPALMSRFWRRVCEPGSARTAADTPDRPC